MPAALSSPGIGPSRIGRFYQPPRNTVLPSPSPIIPVGVDGHVEPAAQGTAVTSQLPTGIVDGDLVFIEVCHGSGGPPGTTITTPAGWTLLSNLDDGSTKLPTFWRFFVTGDAAPSFTLGTSRSWVSHSTAFRYVDPFHPFGPYDLSWQQTAQPSSATYTSGTITPYDIGAMLVVGWGGKIASGSTQTITTASGWGQTAPINQSTIAAVTNQWAHFQYKPLGPPVATSEVVTIGNSAVGQGTIIALRPLGSATPIAYGATGTALHPGQGPSRVARFWQPARSTDIITVGGPTASGASTGEQHTDNVTAGAKNAIGAAQSATRVSGQATGVKGAAGTAQGPARTADVTAARKQAIASAAGQQRSSGQPAGKKGAIAAAIGEQRSLGIAVKGTPPAAPAIGEQRISGTSAGKKATSSAGAGQQRSAGLTLGIHKAMGAAVGLQRTSTVNAGIKAGRGSASGQQRVASLAGTMAAMIPGYGTVTLASQATATIATAGHDTGTILLTDQASSTAQPTDHDIGTAGPSGQATGEVTLK